MSVGVISVLAQNLITALCSVHSFDVDFVELNCFNMAVSTLNCAVV